MMILKKIAVGVRDALSILAVCFLFADGIDKAFPTAELGSVAQHRWLGYLSLLCAFALAHRLRRGRKEIAATREREPEADS